VVGAGFDGRRPFRKVKGGAIRSEGDGEGNVGTDWGAGGQDGSSPAQPGCGGRVVTGGAGGESWRWEADGGGEKRERGRLAGEARESFNGVVAMARARGH
jgi:hypothetical protein